MKDLIYFANKYDYTCFYCKLKFSLNDLSRDHVLPKSKGGGDEEENLVLACKKCNVLRGNGDSRPLPKPRLIFGVKQFVTIRKCTCGKGGPHWAHCEFLDWTMIA